MMPLLNIGPAALNTPGLALLIGLWIALETASREGGRRGHPLDPLFYLGFWSVLAGVAGARLGFVLFNLSLYSGITPVTRALLSVVSPTPGTEIPLFGLIAAALAASLLIRRNKLPLLETLDSFALGGAAFVGFLGLSNLLSGEFYGAETALPWGLPLWGASRHPTQVLLMLGGIAAFAALWRLRPPISAAKPRPVQRAKGEIEKSVPDGMMFQVFLLILGGVFLLVEPLRADSPVILDGVRVWQLIGLGAILLAMGGFAFRAPGGDRRLKA